MLGVLGVLGVFSVVGVLSVLGVRGFYTFSGGFYSFFMGKNRVVLQLGRE